MTRTTKGTIAKNLTSWDFALSVAVSAVFVLYCLNTREPFISDTPPLIAAISLGVGISLGAGVVGRWLGDSTKEDTLGEIMRAIDPSGQHVQTPFRIVMIAGIAISFWGGFLLLVASQVAPTARVWLYGSEVLLVSYGLLSLLDVLLLGSRMQARQAKLRALREQEQRRRGH